MAKREFEVGAISVSRIELVISYSSVVHSQVRDLSVRFRCAADGTSISMLLSSIDDRHLLSLPLSRTHRRLIQ